MNDERERLAGLADGVVARLERAAIASQHPQNAHVQRDFAAEADDWRAIAAILRTEPDAAQRIAARIAAAVQAIRDTGYETHADSAEQVAELTDILTEHFGHPDPAGEE